MLWHPCLLIQEGLSPLQRCVWHEIHEIGDSLGIATQEAEEAEEFELWPEWTLGPDTYVAKNNELISNKCPRCIQTHPGDVSTNYGESVAVQAQIRSFLQLKLMKGD